MLLLWAGEDRILARSSRQYVVSCERFISLSVCTNMFGILGNCQYQLIINIANVWSTEHFSLSLISRSEAVDEDDTDATYVYVCDHLYTYSLKCCISNRRVEVRSDCWISPLFAVRLALPCGTGIKTGRCRTCALSLLQYIITTYL